MANIVFSNSILFSLMFLKKLHKYIKIVVTIRFSLLNLALYKSYILNTLIKDAKQIDILKNYQNSKYIILILYIIYIIS